MAKVILTFDYELFLGSDSGTAEHSIIKPTNEIIDILIKYNAKAIFFVDATYLLALKRFNHPDFGIISEQLKKISLIGSSVELHLHPQWIDAVPIEEKWKFNSFEHYRLHSLNENRILSIFKEGNEILMSIVDKKPIAFRAGGWSIVPFGSLKKAFIENSIKIDMSVLPGFYKKELPLHYYDFRNTPNKEYYLFDDDVCVEDKNGRFLEIPVTTFYLNGYDLVINNLIKKIYKDKFFGDGKGLASSNIKGNLLKRIFSKNLRKATIENQSYYIFKKSLNLIKNRSLISFVMHPKTLSKTSLKNLEYLVQNFETLNSDDLLRICK